MQRRHLLQLAACASFMPHALAAPPARFLHVGTYAPSGRGIYSFAIGPNGALAPQAVTVNDGSPTWLAREGRLLYAAEEGKDAVSVYRQSDDGRLTALQRIASGGRGPCHLSLGAGRLWVAHYGDGRFAALTVQPDGRVEPPASWPSCAAGADCRPGPRRAAKAPPGSLADSGHDAPHAHMIQASPDGRWLLGTDLGRDRLLVWPLTAATPAAPAHELALSPGSGPRHFVFHPTDASLVYVLQETSSTLSTVAFTADGPRVVDEISVLPAGFAGTNYASDLIVAPGGRHLYAFHRLYDSLAVVSLADDPRRPRLLDHHWVRGSTPRSACIAGSWMYVCNQRSDQLSQFDLTRPEAPRFMQRQTPVPSPAGACAM
jgi:6-phosphogluconolactonase (cycloisomerase 2 family)